MTDAERLELQRSTVERVRSHMANERSTRGRSAAQKQNQSRPAGRMALAAQHAYQHGISLSAAARLFGLSTASVGEAWHRIYPDIPALKSRLGATP